MTAPGIPGGGACGRPGRAGLRRAAAVLVLAAAASIPSGAPAAQAYVHGLLDLVATGNSEAITDSLGAARPWDADWDRTEAGLGYRITRGAIAKLVYQTNLRRADPAGEPSRRYDLVAGQLTLRF